MAQPHHALALGFACAASLSPARVWGVQRIVAAERRPIALVVVAPTGEAGNVSGSELIRLVSKALDAHTGFSPLVLEAPLVSECEGKLSCIVPRAAGGEERRFVLVLSNLTQRGAPDVLSAIFVDARAASVCLARGAEERDAEACVLERGVLGKARDKLANEAEAEAFVRAFFAGELRAALEAGGDWEPFGEAQLAVRPRGAAVFVDGAAVGTCAEEEVAVVLAAGEHVLAFELAGFARREVRVRVRSKESVRAEVSLAGGAGAAANEGGVRTAMIAGGVAAAVAGTTIALFAWGRAEGGVADVCLYPAGAAASCGSGAIFERAAYDPAVTPSTKAAVNPHGVLLAPLGYSIALAGAVWALSAIVFDEVPPWMELVAGAALGVGAYGLSAALEGTRIR